MRALFKALTYLVFVGATDAHAKNYSLVLFAERMTLLVCLPGLLLVLSIKRLNRIVSVTRVGVEVETMFGQSRIGSAVGTCLDACGGMESLAKERRIESERVAQRVEREAVGFRMRAAGSVS